MKRVSLLLVLALGCVTTYAQKLDRNEARQLTAFLSQPAAEAQSNAQALGADVKNLGSIEGITIANGHVVSIELKEKKTRRRA